MTKFITLAGKKQTGKDTSARYIKKVIEGASTAKVHIVHFADALKQACSVTFGIPLEDMETETGKQKLTDVAWPVDLSEGVGGYLPSVDHRLPAMYLPAEEAVQYGMGEVRYMTVREVLQFVGTELFRNQIDPDTWVKSVYRKKYRSDDIVVVADCRFPNEAEFARERGVLIGIERNTGLEGDDHKSEKALDGYTGYHHLVDNNASFSDLYHHIKLILRSEGFVQE